MKPIENTTRTVCPSPEISAYIDGELSLQADRELELHVAKCRLCAEDMNLQKCFSNALDCSLSNESNIELPKNFTRSVVANAESHVSGLRRPRERLNAAFICAALILFSLFGLGRNAGKTLAAAMAIVDKVVAVAVSAGHMIHDAALGSAIIFRSLASNLLFESGTSVAALPILCMVSFCLLMRLFVQCRRT